MTRVLVQTDRHIDPRSWAARHTAGDQPDGLPYGLDRLSDHGHIVEHRLPPSSRAALPAKAARALGHRWDWWGTRTVTNRPDIDVNLCWDERSGVPTGVLAQRGGPALVMGVIWLTDELHPGSFAQHSAARALRRAAAVWALSSAQIPVLRDTWGVAPRRLHRLGFGIDADFWQPRLARTARDSSARARVLTVGDDRDRDHGVVLSALAGLSGRDAPELDLVTRQPLQVPDRLGRRRSALTHAELRDGFAAADVVAIALRPNLHVSGMTSVLEAQAMERPVVCTRTPGMEDYVVDGETGILVPVGDVDAFRDAVASLVNDPDRAREMGRKGREFVLRRATTVQQAVQIAGILSAI